MNKGLAHILILSCKKASLLIEKGHAQKLSFLDSLQLSLHLKICDKCKRYQKQSLIIEGLLKSTPAADSQNKEIKISGPFKIKLEEKLEQELKNRKA